MTLTNEQQVKLNAILASDKGLSGDVYHFRLNYLYRKNLLPSYIEAYKKNEKKFIKSRSEHNRGIWQAQMENCKQSYASCKALADEYLANLVAAIA